MDGRSLTPFLHDPNLPPCGPILFESFVETNDVSDAGAIAEPGDQSSRPNGPSASLRALVNQGHRLDPRPAQRLRGIRLGPYKYIAWPDGEKELYDLEKDPYELNNIVRIPNYFPIRNYLHRELRELEDCVGRSCREEASEIPLTPRTAAANVLKKCRTREKKKEKQQRR